MEKNKAIMMEYGRHWLDYGSFLLAIVLVDQIIAGPLFKTVLTLLMQQGQVPLVSKMTAKELLMSHPIVLIAGIGCLYLWLAGIGIIWGIAIRGIMLIRQRRFSLSMLFDRISFWLRPDWTMLVLLDFLWLMPLGQGLFCALRWGNPNYPGLMLDFLTRKTWLLILAGMLYLLIVLAGLLTMRSLIAMAANQISFQSVWRENKVAKCNFKSMAGLFFSLLIFSLLGWSINHFLLLILMELKKFPGKWVWGVAIAFRSLMLLAGFWLLAGAIVSLVLWQLPIKKAGELSTPSKTRWCQAVIWMTIGALVVLTSIMSLPMTWHRPLVISHRGVTQADGVQNTLPAARKTRRLHPDYIEIDVHETADQKFVVMHDENLRQLTGVNREPRQLTLRQLQRLIADENGHHAHLVSFDQYLRFAQKHRQKLLVEIKTTPADSPRMLQHFNQRYGKRLQQNHAWLHTMDLNAAQKLHRLNPRLKLMAIQPYALGWPGQNMGWNVEYSMLSPMLIAWFNFNHQPICVWTVDDQKTMQQAALLGVDGIVTDNVKALDAAIKAVDANHGYAVRLAAQLNVTYDWQNIFNGRK